MQAQREMRLLIRVIDHLFIMSVDLNIERERKTFESHANENAYR